MEKSHLKCGNVDLISLGIMMVNRSLGVFLNKSIKESRLTITQIYIMYAVGEYRGENLSFIAEKLKMDRSTLTRGVCGLPGYVELHKGPPEGDKRAIYPALTKKGADFLEKWMPKVLEIEEELGKMVLDDCAFMRFIKIFSSELFRKKIHKPPEQPQGVPNDVKLP